MEKISHPLLETLKFQPISSFKIGLQIGNKCKKSAMFIYWNIEVEQMPDTNRFSSSKRPKSTRSLPMTNSFLRQD